MPRYEKPESDLRLPALEEEVLARWRERDVFHESMRRREGGKRSQHRILLARDGARDVMLCDV